MSEYELLPCPFCGGKAVQITLEDMYLPDMYTIECSNLRCGACIMVCRTPDEALDEWNRRANVSENMQ